MSLPQLAALDYLAAMEGLNRHQVAGLVPAAALRSFLLAYWMEAAAEGKPGPKTAPETTGAIS